MSKIQPIILVEVQVQDYGHYLDKTFQSNLEIIGTNSLFQETC